MGWLPGVLASLIGALIPLHYWAECVNDFENGWTALFLEIAVLSFARFLQRPSITVRGAAAAGLLWGLGMLLAPVVAPVLAGCIAFGAVRLRPDPRIAVRWVAVLTVTLLAVLAPWLARNAIRLGGLCFVRDDLGLELYVSNHDGVSPIAEENYASADWTATHPGTSLIPAMEVRRLGELAFERQKFKQALEWIHGKPRQFIDLTAKRTFYFWFPSVPRANGQSGL